VPTWHTKIFGYFYHSNFHYLEKKTFFGHLLTIKDLQKICARLRGVGYYYLCDEFIGPFYAGHTDCLGGTINFHGLCPPGTQDLFDKIRVVQESMDTP
jgi:hypothetical protein